MARPEQVVVVIDARELSPGFRALEYRREAVLDDGTRVADSRWRGGSFSAAFFGAGDAEMRLEDDRGLMERALRERHSKSDARRLASLIDALRGAGVEATTEQVRALPLDVEFTDAAMELMREPPTKARNREMPRHVKLWALLAGLVFGAIRPQKLRPPRRVLRDAAIGWAIMSFFRVWRHRALRDGGYWESS